MIKISQHDFIELLKRLPASQLTWLETQIAMERERRDICEHGVLAGEYCELCNREYKRAIDSHGAV